MKSIFFNPYFGYLLTSSSFRFLAASSSSTFFSPHRRGQATTRPSSPPSATLSMPTTGTQHRKQSTKRPCFSQGPVSSWSCIIHRDTAHCLCRFFCHLAGFSVDVPDYIAPLFILSSCNRRCMGGVYVSYPPEQRDGCRRLIGLILVDT